MKASIFLVLFLLSRLFSCGFSKPQNPKPNPNPNPNANLKDAKSNSIGIFGGWTSTRLGGSGRKFSAYSEAVGQENSEPDAETFETDQVDWIGILEAISDEIDKYVSEKVKEITSNISNEISELKQEIGDEHQEIKAEVKTDSIDLKGQITALLKNRSQEVNSAHDELNKKLSLLMDHFQVKAPSSTPPTLSAPHFYWRQEFRGFSFAPYAGWENQCVNLPNYMDNLSESVSLGGHCLLVCPEKDCFTNAGSSPCLELQPDSYGVDNLADIGYSNTISSFRLCHKK